MSDDKKEEKQENPKANHSDTPSKSITPVVDTKKTNSNQEAGNMEVHHHSHHEGKKNWKSYFWEFLMLFLAVFCGFLAEFQLEHVIEHQREKVLVASLLEDLKKDTVSLSDVVEWEEYTKAMDSLANELKKPADQRNDKELYRLFGSMRAFGGFEYHNRTIEQLKNGGNFRLLTDKNLSDSLIDYDTYIVSRLRDQEEQSKVIYQHLNFLQDKFVNAEYYHLVFGDKKTFDSAYEANPTVFRFAEANKDYVFEYRNNLQYFRTITSFRIYTLRNLQRMAGNLIKQINEGK